MKNPKAVGETSEAVILAALIKRGWSVSIPFGNNQRYDMIVDSGGRLSRVQCKTGRVANGCVVFSPNSTNGFTGKRTGYTDQVETFLVYCPEIDKIYAVPVNRVTEASGSLRIAPCESGKAKPNTKWATEFEFCDTTVLPTYVVQRQKKYRPRRIVNKGAWPNRETLARMIWEMPATRVAQQIGVSSVSVKKRCKALGIETPTRGHWAKPVEKRPSVPAELSATLN